MTTSQKMQNIGRLAGFRRGEHPARDPSPEGQSPTPTPESTEPIVAVGDPYPIRLSRVRPFAGNPRRFFDDSKLEELADSIQGEGQVQPVQVVRLDEPGVFELVDGERRYRALHKVWERTGREPTILAYVVVISDRKQHFRKSVLANLHREDLSPADEAAAIVALRRTDTLEGVAALIGKSVSYVKNYEFLDSLPDEVKRFLDPSLPREQQLSVTVAVDIARSTKDADMRMDMAQEVLDRRLGVQDARVLLMQKTGYSTRSYTRTDPRTGERTYARKPSEDYRMVSSFLGRTRSSLDAILADADVDRMFVNVVREREARRASAGVALDVAQKLEKLAADMRVLAGRLEGDR